MCVHFFAVNRACEKPESLLTFRPRRSNVLGGSRHLAERRLRHVIKADFARKHLSISKLADDLEDFGPGGIEPFVDLLVHLNRLDELKLLGIHLALFGLTSVVGATAAGAAAALQAGCLPAIRVAAAL